METVVFCAWLLTGLVGGWVIHRNDPILLSAWPMALLLGPFTLLLGVLEWRAINRARKTNHDPR
jgi:hypothetical protein